MKILAPPPDLILHTILPTILNYKKKVVFLFNILSYLFHFLFLGAGGRGQPVPNFRPHNILTLYTQFRGQDLKRKHLLVKMCFLHILVILFFWGGAQGGDEHP